MNITVAGLAVFLVEQAPEDEDVTAGWTAFAIFILLGIAVAILGWSLTRQLRKAQHSKDTGVYGDAPISTDAQSPKQD